MDLGIYDARGRRLGTVVRAEQPAGEYEAFWNGQDDRGTSVARGIYFARLSIRSGDGEQTLVRKVTLR